jgi:hypothetical protein
MARPAMARPAIGRDIIAEGESGRPASLCDASDDCSTTVPESERDGVIRRLTDATVVE